MTKLSNSSLVSLTTIVLVFILLRYSTLPLIGQFFRLILVAAAVFAILAVSLKILNKAVDIEQGILAYVGFVGGFVLNSILSASYLANFSEWQIETNTGAFNVIDFIEDDAFVLLIAMLILIVALVLIPLGITNKTEKIILIFFGFSVVSLVLAGVNFFSQLVDWLLLIPVAEHWGDHVSFDPSIIVDIIKSLFLAGLFNVLEKIARMRRET